MYMHTYTQTYIYTYTYIYTCTIHTYMHTHTHTYAYAHVCTDRKCYQQHLNVSSNIIDAHTHPFAYACIYIHIYIYKQYHRRTYASICIRMHIHTYIHMPKRKEGEWGETIETNWSRDGLRLKSNNLRRCCRLQDKAQCKGGVRADGVSSLIVAAGERRSLLGGGFENMMCSWVMK